MYLKFVTLITIWNIFIVLLENNKFVLCNENNGNSGSTRGGGSRRQQQCVLPQLPNGVTRFRQRGKLAKFSCTKSYKLIGNMYSGCTNGKWDAPIPVCAKSGCPDLITPNNGFIIMEHDGATALTFCKNGYQLFGSRQIYCNGIKWNQELGICQESSTVSQRECNFETEDLCGWTHDDANDFEWKRIKADDDDNLSHTFLHTGPKHDHTTIAQTKSNSNQLNGGYYMLLESFNHLPDDEARLISPVYESILSVDTCFKFYYHMYGSTVGELKIYIKPMSIDMQAAFRDRKYLLFEVNGSQGNKWLEGQKFIDHNFNESFQIIIEGLAGTSHLNDIAIDDVALLNKTDCIINGTTVNSITSTTIPIIKTTIINGTNQVEIEDNGYIFDIQSCQNRCDETISIVRNSTVDNEIIKNGTGKGNFIKICDCHNDCEDIMTCCPDYRSICAFGITSTATDENQTEIEQITKTTSSITTKPKILIPIEITMKTITTTTKPLTTVARVDKITKIKERTKTKIDGTSIFNNRYTTDNFNWKTTPMLESVTLRSIYNKNTKYIDKIHEEFENNVTIQPFQKTSYFIKYIIDKTARIPLKILPNNNDDIIEFKKITTPIPQSSTKETITTAKTTTATAKTTTITISDSDIMMNPVQTSDKTFNDFEEEQQQQQHDNSETFTGIDEEVKDHHEWETNITDTERIPNDNVHNISIWLIIFLILLSIAIICVLILVINYYRVNYNLKNYKTKNMKKYSNRNHEVYSDVIYLTPNEQLDFNLQKPEE